MKKLAITYEGRVHSHDGMTVVIAPLKNTGWPAVPAGETLTMLLPVQLLGDDEVRGGIHE